MRLYSYERFLKVLTMLKVMASGSFASQPIGKTIGIAMLCLVTLSISACDYGNPKPKKFTKTPFTNISS